jgi:hypothetical protein
MNHETNSYFITNIFNKVTYFEIVWNVMDTEWTSQGPEQGSSYRCQMPRIVKVYLYSFLLHIRPVDTPKERKVSSLKQTTKDLRNLTDALVVVACGSD